MAVMHRHALLVDESVVDVIAEERHVPARGLLGLPEIVDGSRRDVIVLVDEVPLRRNPDVSGLTACGRRPIRFSAAAKPQELSPPTVRSDGTPFKGQRASLSREAGARRPAPVAASRFMMLRDR
jgi:hypothetical protein